MSQPSHPYRDFQANIKQNERISREVARKATSMDETTVRTKECVAESRDLLARLERLLT